MTDPHTTPPGSPLSEVLSGYEHFRDARMNQVAGDYLSFVAALCPAFPLAHWQAVAEALLPGWDDDGIDPTHAWADIDDAQGLGERWGIDQAALVARFRTFGHAELLALREVLRRYRDGVDFAATPVTPAEALRQAGARVVG